MNAAQGNEHPRAGRPIMDMLTRLDDWQSRLAVAVNERRLTPYVYGRTDCACFAQVCVAAVTGVTLMAGIEKPKGWIGAAKFMIAHEWDDVEAMITEIVGPPMASPALSRPGDIISFVSIGEPHLGVRVGDVALSPADKGLEVIAAQRWVRAWKIG